MSKIKLLLDVVSDMRSLADSIQSVADSMAGNTPESQSTEPVPEKHTSPPITMEKEIAKAESRGMPVRYFTMDCQEVQIHGQAVPGAQQAHQDHPVHEAHGVSADREYLSGAVQRGCHQARPERVGLHIREKKNLTGISYDVDETDVVTRIMPTSEDADGNILYLPELYVDSPNIGSYVHPKWVHLPVSEAKEVAEGENYKSLTECYQEMRSAAQAEYEEGCDLPTVTLKVDFINCADTVEYAQYAALSNIFLGDSVRVIARRIGVEVSMRMTQYTYDCLTRKYTSVTLGTVADTLEGSMVSARQLASGSITGAKLALNSVGTGQLQSGSVGSLQIKNAAIGSAHIQDAAITRAHIAEALIDVLNVNALTAVTAKIKELAAGSITADELYTSIAMIATAQLTTANIVNVQRDQHDALPRASHVSLCGRRVPAAFAGGL